MAHRARRIPLLCGSPALGLALAGCVVLGSCGGGGGGGGGGTGEGPTASILFPPGTCLTTDEFIRVRGTADDPQGVQSVTVNGNAAITGDGFQSWTCTVSLASGDNLLVVETTDSDGAVRSSAAQVEVRREGPVPMRATGAALSAAAGTLFVVDAGAGLFAIEVATGARAAVSDDVVGTGEPARTNPEPYAFNALALRPAAARAYVYDEPGSDRILEIDVADGDRSVLSDATHGTGPVLALSVPRMTTAFGTLYVGGLSSTLLSVDVVTGDRTQIHPSAGSGPAISRSTDLDADGAANRLYVLDDLADTLFAVDLVTLARTVVSSSSVGTGPTLSALRDVAVDPAGARAFVRTNDEILSVDLGTGNRAVVADDVTGTGPALVDVCDLAWDPVGGRLLAALFGGGVLSIAPATGDRTLLHEPTFGVGPLDRVEDVAASRDGTRVLFLDDLDGSPALVAISLATGARSVVADAAHGTGATIDSSMHVAVAATGLTAYLTNDDEVLEVDLATGNRMVVTGPGDPGASLTGATDVALGVDPGTLLVTDEASGLLRVSATGSRTVLASLFDLGGSVSSANLAVDPTRGLVYLSNDDGGDLVYVVDAAAPGTATTLSAVGAGSPDPFDGDLDDCAFDARRDALFVFIEGEQNPQADTAIVVSDGGSPGPVLEHTRVDADPARGVLYVSGTGGVTAVDTFSGDRVILALVGSRNHGNL
jgi:DNA-binding beta-propeller fold protein YncE